MTGAADTEGGAALCWRPSALLRRLSVPAVLALALAAALGRAELVAVAAPLLWWLAAADRARPHTARVAVAVAPDRCGEDDEAVVTVTVRLDSPARLLGAELALPAGLRVLAATRPRERAATEHTMSWQVHAGRWGRWTLGPARLRIGTAGGLLECDLSCPARELAVLPAPAPVEAAVLPVALPRRTGEHPVHMAGDGVEFEGLRPYQAGDRPRQINWAASARRRELFVATQQDERSFDLVVVVDAFQRVGPPGQDSLDLSVRGAAGLAAAHLRRGERVGAVAVGGSLRGLAPGVGGHHFHRVAEAVLDVRLDDRHIDVEIPRLPRSVMPPGALAVLFSPLLDERARATAFDLRGRGHPLLIVDVLCGEPDRSRWNDLERLALRLWHLDRAADRFEFGRLGVPVLPWDGTGPLHAALAPLYHRPIGGGRRHGA